MPARSVRVQVHNETGTPLTLRSAELVGGKWSPGGRPPARIEPGTVGSFRSQSDGFLTGTEGRAYFRGDGGPDDLLYVHWNRPYSGDPSYHVNTSGDHDAFWAGGRGDNTTIDVVLRDSRLVTTDFSPRTDGFQFGNHWRNTPYTPPFLRNTALAQKWGNANNGLCGGMVFLALDYYYSGQAVPATENAPPGEQDRLFLNIVDRLFDTVTTTPAGDRLSIESVPEDGAYNLTVRVAARPRGAPDDVAWQDTTISVRGRAESVRGLAEAIRRCYAGYLNRLRTEAPDEQAIVAAAYAQLGRPLDPIWDPDPLMLRPDEWIALADPMQDPDWAVLSPADAPTPDEPLAMRRPDQMAEDDLAMATERGGIETLPEGQPDAELDTGAPGED